MAKANSNSTVMRVHVAEDAAEDGDGVEDEGIDAGEAMEEEQAAGDENWVPELVDHVMQAAGEAILAAAAA